MAAHIPESDWKKFRRLREVALERLYDRTLKEIIRLAADASSGSHQRYLAIYELMQRRDRDMARAFDDPRRSRALQQLSAMHALGLLKVGELNAFTDETREAVEFLSTLEEERYADSMLTPSTYEAPGCQGIHSP